MKVTLELNNIQVAILHALLGQATISTVANAVREDYEEYLATESNSAVYGAYERVIAYMNNHPSYAPFGDEEDNLFDALDDAMTLIGKKFNEEKEN